MQTFGWRSIFFVNVLVGLSALWLTHRHIPNGPPDRSRSLDSLSQLLAVATLATLTYAMIGISRAGSLPQHLLRQRTLALVGAHAAEYVAAGVLCVASGLALTASKNWRLTHLASGMFPSRSTHHTPTTDETGERLTARHRPPGSVHLTSSVTNTTIWHSSVTWNADFRDYTIPSIERNANLPQQHGRRRG